MTPSAGFERHLFISYAHIDNQPLAPDQQGWITRFHASLEAMLSMRMGRKAEIWRDAKLTGSDLFADEIVAQFPRTALMVSVLTPRYIRSDWCTREVREFCQAADRSGGVSVQNKCRIIKVIKTPVDSEEPLPGAVRGVLGYPFYVFDGDGAPLELDPAYGADLAQKYNVKIAKLAFEISQLLKVLEAAGPKPAPTTGKPTIYLAECAYDLRQAREALETELRVLGYPTLPDSELPREETAYVAEAARLLGRCSLSIHLVGGNLGAVPDGPSQKSVLVLQNDLAIERSRTAGLKRLIWIPPGAASPNADHQRFIGSLQNDPAAQFGADLITADLETLKTAVHAILKQIEAPPTQKPVQRTGNERLVYIICDERDRKATLPFRKYLKSRSVETAIPAFEGEAAALRQANQNVLAGCDAVLLFYGAGDEPWKRSVETDLKKAGAFRDGRPLPVYTILAGPPTGDKTDLIDLEEPGLIDALDGFDEARMAPFLAALGVAG